MVDISIIPAVLPRDYADLVATLGHLRGAARRVQIDVCDGKFVKNITFPFSRGDEVYWTRIMHEDEGLPLWQDFDFEVDLMVNEPAALAREWVKAGVTRIVLHTTSTKEITPLIEELKPLVEVGIALPSNASLDDFRVLIEKVSFVQVMGISRVGFQGEPFDERALSIISSIREAFPSLPIQIDGGVSPTSAEALVKAGATSLISGSFVVSSVYPLSAIEELKSAAAKGVNS
jgi:ribulose-phosphate 3-epimerase